jgi:DeoR/GlpR family transcriptional regulator of sugar metabolism
MSGTGLDANRGATTLESAVARLYRKMHEHSKQVVVVTDSSKLSKVNFALICPISKLHLPITDIGTSAQVLKPFVEQGIKILRV